MRIQRYFQLMVWVPLALPLVVLTGAHWFGPPVSGALDAIKTTLVLSLAVGGVPYLALAAWATWWLRVLDPVSSQALMMRLPVLMLPLYWLFASVVTVSDSPDPVDGLIGAALLGAIGTPYVLVLGYLYVAACLLGKRLLGIGGDRERE